MKLLSIWKEAEEPAFSEDMVHAAYDECIELGVVDRESCLRNFRETLCYGDRHELYILDGAKVVGTMFVSEWQDLHVGMVTGVLICYVLPSYRSGEAGLLLYREALRIARLSTNKVFLYTRRVGDWEYRATYKVIHGQDIRRRQVRRESAEGSG